jgi:predicted alpha/beta-hydrolase family hydrolase
MSDTRDSDILVSGPPSAPHTFLFAHGAGAGMDTDFMNAVADGLAKQGIRVIRFEFPYMAERRRTGKRKPPDREPVLRLTWQQRIAAVSDAGPGGGTRLVIGGKSMGGRIASMLADDVHAAGLVCLGYPFHPAGKPDKLRVEHLRTLKAPALIVQGQRDALGGQALVTGLRLPSRVTIHWLTDGDHSFKPRKASGRSLADNLTEAIDVTARFIKTL